MECLTGYNFTVTWSAGPLHQFADALSRAPVFPSSKEDEDEDLNSLVCYSATVTTGLDNENTNITREEP